MVTAAFIARNTPKITSKAGLLTANGGNPGGGGQIAGSGTKALTISGTLAQVNADLATLLYKNAGAGTDIVTVATSDGSLSDTHSIAIAMNHVPLVAAGATATGAIAERAATTGSTVSDIASGTIKFTDADAADKHVVSVTCVAATGVATGLPSGNALLAFLSLGAATEPAGTAAGSAAWSFAAPDSAFDYLAAGEKAILTFAAQVSDGHGGIASQNIAVTVTGANDAPAIAAST